MAPLACEPRLRLKPNATRDKALDDWGAAKNAKTKRISELPLWRTKYTAKADKAS